MERGDSHTALFVDCDVLFRGQLDHLFRQADPKYAVQVVKHNFNPPEGVKMDGQAQLRYARKNWSSVMLFNVHHKAHEKLTLDLLNGVPGRDLHGFCWLDDSEIGELDPMWNYLVGHHTKDQVDDPRIVHFTDGIPSMRGYEDCEYSDEWRSSLYHWASRI
jgi:lipopolysaccharide biosynthesis glycosyltransferase